MQSQFSPSESDVVLREIFVSKNLACSSVQAGVVSSPLDRSPIARSNSENRSILQIGRVPPATAPHTARHPPSAPAHGCTCTHRCAYELAGQGCRLCRNQAKIKQALLAILICKRQARSLKPRWLRQSVRRRLITNHELLWRVRSIARQWPAQR
jgi:hypothetical protein